MLPADAKVKGLADIKAGLAKDFGENEFPTQLTNARLAYPAVRFDFDMMRASTTNMRSFGADVFGIGIYHRVAVDNTGSFAVQTPDGVQSVLWSSFHEAGGWFQMAHGQTTARRPATRTPTARPGTKPATSSCSRTRPRW